MLRAEYETKWNCLELQLYFKGHYEEDYQMEMLRRNFIPGLLKVNGCEVEGEQRYTFDISGYTSMKKYFEKELLQEKQIQGFVTFFLEMAEELQKYLLDMNGLILDPEYIFMKNEKWFFCYVPGNTEKMEKSFHELTEFFLRKLDYEDTGEIVLAYELHKATLQEQYNLKQILEDCAKQKRKVLLEERKEFYDNTFYLTDENMYEPLQVQSENDLYHTASNPPMIREKKTGWLPWRRNEKKNSHKRKKRWGSWDELIVETDEPQS